jgi:hypothetical protein
MGKNTKNPSGHALIVPCKNPKEIKENENENLVDELPKKLSTLIL